MPSKARNILLSPSRALPVLRNKRKLQNAGSDVRASTQSLEKMAWPSEWFIILAMISSCKIKAILIFLKSQNTYIGKKRVYNIYTLIFSDCLVEQLSKSNPMSSIPIHAGILSRSCETFVPIVRSIRERLPIAYPWDLLVFYFL